MPRTKSKLKTRSKTHRKKALATRKRISKANASRRRARTSPKKIRTKTKVSAR
jgi:hypothetical protein